MIKLSDVPSLPPHRFYFANSVFACHIPRPCRFDGRSGAIVLDKGWKIVGWGPKLEGSSYKEDMMGLMFFHPDEGEVWAHYPYREHMLQKMVFEEKPNDF